MELIHAGTDEPDWVAAQINATRRNTAFARKRDVELRLARIREKELRQKQRYETGEAFPKRRKAEKDTVQPKDKDNEEQFLLGDYESDDETVVAPQNADEGLSAASLGLLTRLGMISAPAAEDELVASDETKIFYCSRTHSQLTQFAHEVRRVKFPSKWNLTGSGTNTDERCIELEEQIKFLSLGARKNLCINAEVSKLSSATLINEKCLELQQTKTLQDQRCTFLPNKDNEPLVHDFRDHALAKVRDIEDLGILGKKIGICPYYATRAAVKPSEIVTLPYPLLLQKTARESLDLSLKGHIVIIDEAHNLIDAIAGINSVSISLTQLKRSRTQLGTYVQKFRNKLKGKNRVYVTQTIRLIDSIAVYLETKAKQSHAADGNVNVVDVMSGKGVDQINLYKLSRYLRESKLARKVDGYNVFANEQQTSVIMNRFTNTPVLSHIQDFFQTLTYPAAEGRYFFEKREDNDLSLKYMLLDPAYHFRDVVEDARAVILAGGTMSPMDDYMHNLFPYLDPSRIMTLSCGHVIPDENMSAWPIANGPSGFEFDFTFGKRNLPNMIDELGRCIVDLARTIPDGLVVFFPSYGYIEQVVANWTVAKAGTRSSLWDQLIKQKPLFRESKEGTSIEGILEDYSRAIDAGKGALLLSVVGGKMSEGINFSDRLGRGVVIVGLPFPNSRSAEWKAKLEYIEQSAVSRGGSAAEGKAASRSFYENACMRAVNQSIGRAIRHRGDYATIIMLDRRYNTPRIQDKLSGWIRTGLVKEAGSKRFGDAIESIESFFRARKAMEMP